MLVPTGECSSHQKKIFFAIVGDCYRDPNVVKRQTKKK